MGEAAGVAPEQILKALLAENHGEYGGVVVVGDLALFKKVSKELHLQMSFTAYVEKESELVAAQSRGELYIFYNHPCIDLEEFEYGVISAQTGRATYECTEIAVRLIQNTYCSALVTPALDARALKLAGIRTDRYESMIGVFASSGKGTNMYDVGGIKMFALTSYMPLKKALEEISFEKILDTIIKVDSLTGDRFVFDSQLPIAIASVNPHYTDESEWGEEERNEIAPAVETAKRIGINVVGPVAADYMMHEAKKGKYRAVITTYYEQASISAMSFDFYKTVIVTWGWPFLRVGVRRGARLDIAGKGEANPLNLIQALHIASAYIQIGVNA